MSDIQGISHDWKLSIYYMNVWIYECVKCGATKQTQPEGSVNTFKDSFSCEEFISWKVITQ